MIKGIRLSLNAVLVKVSFFIDRIFQSYTDCFYSNGSCRAEERTCGDAGYDLSY